MYEGCVRHIRQDIVEKILSMYAKGARTGDNGILGTPPAVYLALPADSGRFGTHTFVLCGSPCGYASQFHAATTLRFHRGL